MKPLREDLFRDQFHTAVRRRRHKRMVLSSTTLFVPLALFLGILLTRNHDSPSPTPLAVAPSPLLSSPENSLPYHPVTSTEELLTLLADQGPVLVNHPDGSQTLILTESSTHLTSLPSPTF